MTELERHPQAARQGAAAVAVVMVTAAGMPAMAMRAEDQRADADQAERAIAFQEFLQTEARRAARADADLVFDVAAAENGWRARAQTAVADNAFYGKSFLVASQVRGEHGGARFQNAAVALTAKNKREQQCLAQAIYYEARGESRVGQLAVAEVVANRVRSSVYPNSYCGVVYQGSERATGCQFTFTCDGSLGHRPRGPAWREANQIAVQVLAGTTKPMTGRATHYHTTAISPYWSSSLVETTRIGAHVFYRFPNRDERAQMASIRRRPRNDLEVVTASADNAPVQGVIAQGAVTQGVVAAQGVIAPSPQPAPIADAPVETVAKPAEMDPEI